MPRKTLKQKLKRQLRIAKGVAAIQHSFIEESAENSNPSKIAQAQAAGLAHGIIATLAELKNIAGENSEIHDSVDKNMKSRIAQCYVALLNTGLTKEEANARIMRGF